jgi:hypothetical protein
VQFDLHWTQESKDHILRHGVSPDEVEQAIDGRSYVRGIPGGYSLIGSAGSRVLFIVFRRSTEKHGLADVVTARDATRPEKQLLRQRGKGSR